jgi:hypothetical protein
MDGLVCELGVESYIGQERPVKNVSLHTNV